VPDLQGDTDDQVFVVFSNPHFVRKVFVRNNKKNCDLCLYFSFQHTNNAN
jgi:hypothetical protein